jgi:hypothetical protein
MCWRVQYPGAGKLLSFGSYSAPLYLLLARALVFRIFLF